MSLGLNKSSSNTCRNQATHAARRDMKIKEANSLQQISGPLVIRTDKDGKSKLMLRRRDLNKRLMSLYFLGAKAGR